MSLQQNSMLHNKFSEINIKNVILLDSDSNVTIMYDEDHIEHA